MGYIPSKGLLFSGDVLYEGELIWDSASSDPLAYIATLQKMIDMKVNLVFPGHGPPFDGARMKDLAKNAMELMERHDKMSESSVAVPVYVDA